MASKKELAQQLEQAEAKLTAMEQDKLRVREGNKRYVAEQREQIAALSDSNAAYAARESRRQRAEHEAEQHRLREKERAERKEHLTNLGAGVLNLKRASEHGISKDEDGMYRLDVTFKLDAEEYGALEDVLRPPKPKPVTYHFTQDIINNMLRHHPDFGRFTLIPQIVR